MLEPVYPVALASYKHKNEWQRFCTREVNVYSHNLSYAV